MDWFVVLTPLLVLAVIGILGFAGCDLVFTLDPPTQDLRLVVNVPAQLTVNMSQFEFLRPGSTVAESTTLLDRADDGSGIIALSTTLKDAETGLWQVTCRMAVQDNVRQATDATQGNFTVETHVSGDAIFETSGRPGNNDFKIRFLGFSATQ